MAAADLKAGDVVLRGLLYRWVPNTQLSYDYNGGKPNKVAFRPGKDEAGIAETGISVFLADLVQPADVIHGLDGYGVCEFTAEAFLEELRRLRASNENDFDEDVTVEFEPNAWPVKGHGHCYIDPMPSVIQKALYKRLAKMTAGYTPGPPVAGRSASEDASGP